jgi:hypothetical protein
VKEEDRTLIVSLSYFLSVLFQLGESYTVPHRAKGKESGTLRTPHLPRTSGAVGVQPRAGTYQRTYLGTDRGEGRVCREVPVDRSSHPRFGSTTGVCPTSFYGSFLFSPHPDNKHITRLCFLPAYNLLIAISSPYATYHLSSLPREIDSTCPAPPLLPRLSAASNGPSSCKKGPSLTHSRIPAHAAQRLRHPGKVPRHNLEL